MKISSKEIWDWMRENKEAAIPSAMNRLYLYYREACDLNTEEIKSLFSHLNDVLEKLTLQECDGVWDTTCMLCSIYEREAFLSGLKTGASLMLELLENGQGRDSCFSQKETAL